MSTNDNTDKLAESFIRMPRDIQCKLGVLFQELGSIYPASSGVRLAKEAAQYFSSIGLAVTDDDAGVLVKAKDLAAEAMAADTGGDADDFLSRISVDETFLGNLEAQWRKCTRHFKERLKTTGIILPTQERSEAEAEAFDALPALITYIRELRSKLDPTAARSPEPSPSDCRPHLPSALSPESPRAGSAGDGAFIAKVRKVAVKLAMKMSHLVTRDRWKISVQLMDCIDYRDGFADGINPAKFGKFIDDHLIPLLIDPSDVVQSPAGSKTAVETIKQHAGVSNATKGGDAPPRPGDAGGESGVRSPDGQARDAGGDVAFEASGLRTGLEFGLKALSAFPSDPGKAKPSNPNPVAPSPPAR